METVLIVSATSQEIQPILNKFEFKDSLSPQLNNYIFHGKKISVLITGVGMVATAFELGKVLSQYKFALAINLGIAGAFNLKLGKGEVYNVVADCFAEQGAQDGDGFIPLCEMGFLEDDSPISKNGWITNEQVFANVEIERLPKVKGITVNQVHGEEKSIVKVVQRLNPEIESMEGAAFFYACLSFGIPCAQIRSISNYVERRNRADWDIPLALKNLNEIGLKVLSKI